MDIDKRFVTEADLAFSHNVHDVFEKALENRINISISKYLVYNQIVEYGYYLIN